MACHLTPARAVLVVAALSCMCARPTHAAPPLECLVPAYQYPTLGDLWSRITLAAARIPVVAIVDPDNGPGQAVDPNYASVVTALRAAGGRALGYVPTGYTDSSLAGVIAKVDAWRAFYPLDGFFIDETTSDASLAHLNYYATVDSAIKTRDAAYRVVLNPGTGAVVDYFTRPCGDTQVVFENQMALLATPPPAWVPLQPARRSASLVYAVPTAAAMRASIALVAQRGEGLVYVTDDLLPNPWDTLSAYWEEEVAVIETTHVTNTVGVPLAGAVGRLRMSDPRPNPSAGETVLTLTLPARESITVRALDLAGRSVATLMDAELSAGDHVLRWNGRGPRGHAVAPGAYWIVARTEHGSAVRKIVRLR